ncbi:MAG: sugar phosphate nucleotidyltransferase [Spirochaetota bacterium]|nr:sugar phosphate nucleotidyltransferase [Spirochaetota bacterium]
MKVLAIILAGGKGKELTPLVEDRSKAAVPYFGKYRVVDFALSNCLNSGIRQVNVVVQHRFASLIRHIRDGWNIYSPAIGEYIDVYPPQQRRGEHWYAGTADAIYQNLFSIENENPDYVLTLSGDHIYRMDYRDILNYHIEKRADLTISAISIPGKHTARFGVMEVDEENRLTHFEEKPEKYQVAGDCCLASMGIYVFTASVLKDIFLGSDRDGKEYKDFGADIFPDLIGRRRVFAYPFEDERGNPGYWNVLRTLRDYYDGNMDILNNLCEIDMYDRSWPFRTYQSQSTPTRSFGNPSGENHIVNSAISGGGLIEGTVRNSILGTNVVVEPGASVSESILFDNVHVKSGATLTKAIVDKGITIPANSSLSAENQKGWQEFTLTDDIIVLGKSARPH